MKVAVIIPAAGASSRYAAAGGLRSKLDEDLGGKSILQRTVELFTKVDRASTIIVSGPAEPAAASEFRLKYGDRLGLMGAQLVTGGLEHRFESVQNALKLVDADCTHIAVHDAARPCISLELIERLFDVAEDYPAVIPAIPVPDTIKRVATSQERMGKTDNIAAILGVLESSLPPLRYVDQTVDRSGLFLVQTPQVFTADLLRRAYSQADLTSTDDASLVERLGERIVVIDGEARNIKITYPADVDLARAILGVKAPEGRAAHKKF